MITARPLFGIHYDEYINHRGEINGTYEVVVKYANTSKSITLYETFSEEYAKLALKKLKDYWDIYLRYWLDFEHLPVMFELHDSIYRSEYLITKQSCICGSSIPGNNKYGSFCFQPEKFDYIRDFIFFYEKDDCLVKDNQLFLNGELIFNAEQLKEKCDEIGQDFNKLDLYPDKLINYMRDTYNIGDYICNGYASHNIKAKED